MITYDNDIIYRHYNDNDTPFPSTIQMSPSRPHGKWNEPIIRIIYMNYCYTTNIRWIPPIITTILTRSNTPEGNVRRVVPHHNEAHRPRWHCHRSYKSMDWPILFSKWIPTVGIRRTTFKRRRQRARDTSGNIGFVIDVYVTRIVVRIKIVRGYVPGPMYNKRIFHHH